MLSILNFHLNNRVKHRCLICKSMYNEYNKLLPCEFAKVYNEVTLKKLTCSLRK